MPLDSKDIVAAMVAFQFYIVFWPFLDFQSIQEAYMTKSKAHFIVIML